MSPGGEPDWLKILRQRERSSGLQIGGGRVVAHHVGQGAPIHCHHLITHGQAGLFGSYHAGSAEGGAFINGATSGGYRTTLRPDQIAAGLARLGPLMADLGYDAEAYRSAA